MPLWIIALSVVVLLAALIGLFVTAAVVIRRDFKDRFDQARARLENDANAIIDQLLTEDKRT
ncbi:MAG TPA: hypothetical protein VK886_08060 [Vicinamibacterales bacterium]|nr:hypothetical protein [Vicinamibacterales bacterium]